MDDSLCADPVGSLTLQRIQAMPQFNAWMAEAILPFVRGDVMEVGCGIGNLTRFLLRAGDAVTGIDLREEYVRAAEAYLEPLGRFRGCVADIATDLPAEAPLASFDSVVMLNVLEHIRDEQAALQNVHRLLRPGGSLICLVPAHPWLYGSLDENLGHYRRYTQRALTSALEMAGLKVTRQFYFNAAGIVGWWINGRVLRADALEEKQLGIFEMSVAVFRIVDRILHGRVGQSLIAVAQKPSLASNPGDPALAAQSGHAR